MLVGPACPPYPLLGPLPPFQRLTWVDDVFPSLRQVCPPRPMRTSVRGADRADHASHSASRLVKSLSVGTDTSSCTASEPQKMTLRPHFSCLRDRNTRSHSGPLEFKAREVAGVFKAFNDSFAYLESGSQSK